LTHKKEGAALGVKWPRGVLLHGPSGVGKSGAVAQIAYESRSVVHIITPASLIGQYVGESERRLREVFEAAEEGASTAAVTHIILIDEADALFPKRKQGNQQEARLVGQLLTLMDGMASKTEGDSPGHVVIIAVTTHPNVLDAALRRSGRIDVEVAVPVPDYTARKKILAGLVKQIRSSQDLDVDLIASKCHGYTGADLMSLCSAALLRTLPGVNSSWKDGVKNNGDMSRSKSISTLDFLESMEDIGPSVARSVVEKFPPAKWDEIGGLDEVKLLLKQYTVWPITKTDAFKQLGIHFPRGVLLHGPPGCAKTTLARAAVTESGATFIPVLGTNLYSMYIGEGEAELRRAFTKARLSSPSVLFIDEIDSLVGSRGDGGQSSHGVEASTRLLTTFLTEIDGIGTSSGVLVLATTNRPFAIDSALLRPGRFDTHIYVPPPDFEGRLQALKVHTRHVPKGSDVSLELIAESTDNYTGAELEAVCREATMAALRENVEEASCVAQRHYEEALQGVKPAHTVEELQKYALWPKQ